MSCRRGNRTPWPTWPTNVKAIHTLRRLVYGTTGSSIRSIPGASSRWASRPLSTRRFPRRGSAYSGCEWTGRASGNADSAGGTVGVATNAWTVRRLNRPALEPPSVRCMDTPRGSASGKITQPAVEGRQEASYEWAHARTGPGAVALDAFRRLKTCLAGRLVLAASMQPPQGRIRGALAGGALAGGWCLGGDKAQFGKSGRSVSTRRGP